MECEIACEQVICAAGQTAWRELQEEGTCARKMCPDPYQVEKKCIEQVRPNQQCYCPKDFIQTYVSPNLVFAVSSYLVIFSLILISPSL